MEENLVKKNDSEEKKKRGLFFVLGKRFKKGRLGFLILAFVVTLVGLATGTYAWFTSNQTVSVQEIEVNVSSGSGIQISTDATTWKSIITVDDITKTNPSVPYPGVVNQVPSDSAQINPVSTVKAPYTDATTKSTGLHMYKGTITNDVETGAQYLDSVSETDGTDLDYIAFDLFLKLDFKEAESPKQIYFTGTTGVTAGTPNTNIEYAARMGFVIQGTKPSTSTVETLYNMKSYDPDEPPASTDGLSAAQIFIYEPNYDVHTSNGLINGRDNYQITNRSASGNAAPATMYGVKAAFAYNSANANSGTPINSHDSDKFAVVAPDIYTTAGNTANFAFTSLPVGVTKIRVYMWIEGQDIDCENTASGGEVKFNLGFTTVAPNANS